MNTETLAELQWEQLFVSCWQRGKTKVKTLYYYTIWDCVQIRGKENPTYLNVFVHGQTARWLKAGVLRKRGDEWIFHPNKTSFAAEILEAIITKYLT